MTSPAPCNLHSLHIPIISKIHWDSQIYSYSAWKQQATKINVFLISLQLFNCPLWHLKQSNWPVAGFYTLKAQKSFSHHLTFGACRLYTFHILNFLSKIRAKLDQAWLWYSLDSPLQIVCSVTLSYMYLRNGLSYLLIDWNIRNLW